MNGILCRLELSEERKKVCGENVNREGNGGCEFGGAKKRDKTGMKAGGNRVKSG
jgi:hypothetical protein